MLDESKLNDFYPVIMTPSHDGKYFHNYTISLLNIRHFASSHNLMLDVQLLKGESLVTRARNNCVANFLGNDNWTHLFFIDSDIGFSIDAFYRLLLSDYNVVAGAYRLKNEYWAKDKIPTDMTPEEFEIFSSRYTINTYSGTDDTIEINVNSDGFFKAAYAPTGFMCIKRETIEKMVKHYPEYAYNIEESYKHKYKENSHYRFFDCSVDPQTGIYLSEDYHFCRLWSEMGGDVYVDAQSNLTHQGFKVYDGSYSECLKQNLSGAISGKKGDRIYLNHKQPLMTNGKGSS